MISAKLDSQLTALGIEKVEKPGAKWKVVSVRLLDEVLMGQASVIQVVTLDEKSQRKSGVICNSDWDERNPQDAPPTPIPTEGYSGPKFGTCQFPMTGVIRLDKDGKLQSRGNHRCWVGDREKSEEVAFMGLVNGKPTSFEVTFQEQPAAPKPPVKK